MTTANSTRSTGPGGSACSGRLGSLIGLVFALGLVLAGPGTPPAEAAGCQANQIAVVVSFNTLDGGTQTACIQDVESGLEALDAAGFDVTPVAGQPFVCRINEVPAADPCQRIPPATAYWAYWTAPMGGSWAYSTTGAGSTDPQPGSVEGWSFGADIAPDIDPPAALSAAEADASESALPRSAAEDSAGRPSATDSSPGGPPWAVIGTVVGLGILGGAAFAQQRRRQQPPPGTVP